MTKKEIATLLGINESEVTENIITKIERIEKEGFIFNNHSTKNFVTKSFDNIVGSFGDFQPEIFENIEGIDYKILTFEKENEKRYCILDNENNLVKMPLSRLNYYDSIYRNDELIKELSEIQQNFKNKGIEITKCEIWNALNLHKIDKYKEFYGENYFDNYFKELFESMENLNNYNLDEVRHELFVCGKDRQADMIYEISNDFISSGYNSFQQSYITDVFYDLLKQKEIQKINENTEYLPTKKYLDFFEINDVVFKKIKELYLENKNKDVVKTYIENLYKEESSNIYYPIIDITTNKCIEAIKNDSSFNFIDYKELQKISYNLKTLQENFDIPKNIVNAAKINIYTQLFDGKIKPYELYSDYNLDKYSEEFDLRNHIQKGINFIYDMSKTETNIKEAIENNLKVNKIEIEDKTKKLFNEFVEKKSLNPMKYFKKRYCEEKIPEFLNKIEKENLQVNNPKYIKEKINEFIKDYNDNDPLNYYNYLLNTFNSKNSELTKEFISVEMYEQIIDNTFYSSNIPKLMETIRKIDPEKAKNLIPKVLKECDHSDIPELIEQLIQIDSKNVKNYLTKDMLKEIYDNYIVNYYSKNESRIKALPNLLEKFDKIDSELTKEFLKTSIDNYFEMPLKEMIDYYKENNPEFLKKYVLKEEILFDLIKEKTTYFDIPELIDIVKDIKTFDSKNINNYMTKEVLDEIVKKLDHKAFLNSKDSQMDLMEQIYSFNPDYTKNYINNLLNKNSNDYQIISILNKTSNFDTENMNEYLQNMLKNYYYSNNDVLISEFIKKQPEFAKKYMTNESFILTAIENCDSYKIPNLIKTLKKINPENPKEYLTENVIISAIKQNNDSYDNYDNYDNFSVLIKEIKEINPENLKEYLTENVLKNILENCNNTSIPKIIEEFIKIDPENSKNILTENVLVSAIENCHSSYMPELLEKIRLTYSENTKNLFSEKIIEKIFDNSDEMSKIMQQIRLIDFDMAKELIPKSIQNCKNYEIPKLIKELDNFGYENIKEFIPKNIFDNILQDLKQFYPVDISKDISSLPIEILKDNISEKFFETAVKNCFSGKIPNLIESFNLINPEITKEFLSLDILKEAIDKAPNEKMFKILSEINLMKHINLGNNEEFINLIIDKDNLNTKYVTQNILTKVLEIKDLNMDIISNLIENKKIEISDIPKESISDATFIKNLIHNHTEKIEDIEKICTKEVLQNEEINSKISKIKEVNTENIKTEEISTEIKPNQKENVENKELFD